MEPFELPESAPVLYFNHNHNNSVYKKVNKQVHKFSTRVGTIVGQKNTETSWSNA